MKYFITILLFVISTATFGQQPSCSSLNSAIVEFDNALQKKDSTALRKLLSDKLSYGHSNGWIETKQELIDDLYNGKLTYTRILATPPAIQTEGNVAAARSIADIDAIMDGKAMSFKLKVLQVWIWKKGHWALFARQSVPVPQEK